MQFLITGAAGFLGSALANRLVKEGHEVRGLDDLSAGNPDSLSPDVHFTRGDINDRPKLWTLLQDVDCVYHLAARVFVPESMLYPREYNLVNVGGTVTLMEAMRDVGVRRVVFISSGSIYGNQETQPVSESVNDRPTSPYAVSKLAAEYYINTIGKLWGIETVCLRVFNAYGPGQQMPPVHTPVIPNFIKQTLSGGTVVVQGDGNQTRDFVFLDDVIRAMIKASTAPNVNQQIINVGSGVETSIRHISELVSEITGKKAEVIYNHTSDNGVKRMCADLKKSRELLGILPVTPLEIGLQLTLERDPRFDFNP
jgi:UDP-glucose 4-epimerase